MEKIKEGDRHKGQFLGVWIKKEKKAKVQSFLLQNNITLTDFINFHFDNLIKKQGL